MDTETLSTLLVILREPLIRIQLTAFKINAVAALDDLAIDSGYSRDKIIRYKCGYTAGAINDLLGFRQVSKTILQSEIPLNEQRAYLFELSCRNATGNGTILGHCFILINIDGTWIMIDSYLSISGKCRELTVKAVDINKIISTILSLNDNYDVALWNELCDSSEIIERNIRTSQELKTVRTVVTTYDYSLLNVINNYRDFADLAKAMLESGHSDIHDFSVLTFHEDPRDAMLHECLDYIDNVEKDIVALMKM